MRLIDADALGKYKFHPLPYTYVIPEGVEEESYVRGWNDAIDSIIDAVPAAEPEIIRCHQCGFWDRETLQHQFNDFRDWNEAECLLLAERDGYHEINRYTEADDFCSRAERRTE